MNRNIKPLKESKKEMLFSGLHVLLTAGLDFSHSFRLLIEEEKEEKIRLLLKEIYASVVDGDTLNGSFARSRQFGALDCGVLRIGEETGRIAEALAFLADYYRKRIEQRRMISGGGKLSGHHLGDRLGGFGVYGHCYCADVRAGICPYGK